MASFWFLVALMMLAFMASSPLPSLSSPLNLETSTTTTAISASPALLSNPPLSSPLIEISPDIAPLLPSPGGTLPSPMVSSVPTIPSNPSPPNPDGMVAALGPATSAFSPFGSLPDSSSDSLDLLGWLNLAVFVGLVGYWLV